MIFFGIFYLSSEKRKRKKGNAFFLLKGCFFNINMSDKFSQSCSYISTNAMENSRLRTSTKRELLGWLFLESDAYIAFERLNLYLLFALGGWSLCLFRVKMDVAYSFLKKVFEVAQEQKISLIDWFAFIKKCCSLRKVSKHLSRGVHQAHVYSGYTWMWFHCPLIQSLFNMF